MPPHRLSRLALVASLALIVASCGSFAYRARQGPPNFNRVAIDENLPHSTTRRSYWWGLRPDEWTPSGCADEPAPADGQPCQQPVPVCGGRGAGRVEVSHTWPMGLVSAVTVGIVNPARVTIYCRVDSGASDDCPFDDPADCEPAVGIRTPAGTDAGSSR